MENAVETEMLSLVLLTRGLLGGLGLLRKEHGLDVRQDAALRDGHAGEKPVELLIVPDGQLQVPGDDPGLLVVPGGITCQLEDLSSQVLHDGGQVDGGTSSDTFGIVSFTEKPVDTTNRELKSSTG